MKRDYYITKESINEAGFWKKGKPPLGRLDIELTERCNNNCAHCCINLPADDIKAKKKELSTDEIKRILKEAVSLGCLCARLTGGEPLLRNDFEEIYVFARRQGLKVILLTNATLITPQLAELFSRIMPLEKIEVSVYGMRKSSYEAVTRVNGSFEAAWRGINFLLDYKIPFVVKGALMPFNKDEIEEFEAWAATIPWMDMPPGYSLFFCLRNRRDDPGKNLLIKKMMVPVQEGVKFLARRKKAYIEGMKAFCSKFMRISGKTNVFCCDLGHGACVDAYGKFQACMMLKHPDYSYDLRKGGLKDALESVYPRMKEIKASNPEYLTKCVKCFLKGLCEQCPAKSWTEYGTLDTLVEYCCEAAHTQARFLGLINEKEKAWEVKDWQARIRNFVEN